MQRGLRSLAITIGVLMALSVVVWMTASVVAKRATQRALAADWPYGLGPASTVPRKFPKSEANAEAKVVGDLALKVGANLQPRIGKVVPPETPEQKEFGAIREVFGNYVSGQVAKADDFIDAPPEKLVAFLNAHVADVDALRAELLRGERMDWPIDVQRLFDAPLPNVLGHMQLMKLYTASALIKGRNNDPSAWDDLHAVWNLGENLRRRPEIISQLIALAGARMVNAAARKLSPPEPAWRAEMKSFDFRRSLVESQQTEAWIAAMVLLRTPPEMEDTEREFFWKPMMLVMRPYLAMGGADLLEHHRQAALAMAALRTCAFNEQTFNDQVQASIPKWNVFGRAAFPALGSMYHRAIHLTPEIEATTNLLRLKQERAASPSHEWPAAISDASSRCEDGTWQYEKRRDGSAMLRFSKSLPQMKTAPQPLEFSLAK